MSKLVIIDGNAILHRAYHAMPQLTTPKGEPIGAVYGFVSMLLNIINALKPTHLTVCFDEKEETFRKKKYKNYQAKRPPMDPFLVSQIIKTRVFLKSAGVSFYSKSGYEADDVIGTLAKQAIEISNKNILDHTRSGRAFTPGVINKHQPLSTNHSPLIDEVVIVSGDRDLFQLINKNVKVFTHANSLNNGKLWGIDEVKQEFDFDPVQIIDYKALVGDSSDNYPGVTGIGPKTARDLIVRYKTVENIYKNIGQIEGKTKEKLLKGRKDAFFFKKLATIKKDMKITFDIEKCSGWNFGSEDVVKLFGEFGFRTLLNRIKYQVSSIKYEKKEEQERLF